MPLTLAKPGESLIIKKIGGRTEDKMFLGNLGLLPGEPVTVVAHMGGNLIVNVKGSRVAVSREMANRISV